MSDVESRDEQPHEDAEHEPAEGAIDTDETWQRWKAYAERLGIAT